MGSSPHAGPPLVQRAFFWASSRSGVLKRWEERRSARGDVKVEKQPRCHVGFRPYTESGSIPIFNLALYSKMNPDFIWQLALKVWESILRGAGCQFLRERLAVVCSNKAARLV
jgi:hypothetical protein